MDADKMQLIQSLFPLIAIVTAIAVRNLVLMQ